MVISTPLPMGAINYRYHPRVQAQLSKQWARPSTCLLKQGIITLCSNLYGVSISTSVFQVYMLQVQVNRCNYNSCVIINITLLRQSCYISQEGRKANQNNFSSEPHSPHFLVRATSKSSSFHYYFFVRV